MGGEIGFVQRYFEGVVFVFVGGWWGVKGEVVIGGGLGNAVGDFLGEGVACEVNRVSAALFCKDLEAKISELG